MTRSISLGPLCVWFSTQYGERRLGASITVGRRVHQRSVTL